MNCELTGVLEAFNDGIILLDDTGMVMQINSAVEHLTGVAADNCLGGDIREIAELGPVPDYIYHKVLEKKGAGNMMEQINGRQLFISGNYILDSEGKLTRVIIVIKDLHQLHELLHKQRLTNQQADRQGDVIAGKFNCRHQQEPGGNGS